MSSPGKQNSYGKENKGFVSQKGYPNSDAKLEITFTYKSKEKKNPTSLNNKFWSFSYPNSTANQSLAIIFIHIFSYQCNELS